MQVAAALGYPPNAASTPQTVQVKRKRGVRRRTWMASYSFCRFARRCSHLRTLLASLFCFSVKPCATTRHLRGQRAMPQDQTSQHKRAWMCPLHAVCARTKGHAFDSLMRSHSFDPRSAPAAGQPDQLHGHLLSLGHAGKQRRATAMA